jgi:hypothetical protein
MIAAITVIPCSAPPGPLPASIRVNATGKAKSAFLMSGIPVRVQEGEIHSMVPH